MIGFCIVFSFGVSYIAYNGINGLDRREYRHQRDPDQRLDRLLGDRHRLSPEP